MSEHNIVAEWLKIAHDDYNSAKYLFDNMNPKPLEIICYHCQQAVEKSLKAFLCSKGVEIPKTHDVGLLCQQCAEFDDGFKSFQEACDEMVVYATHTRYPIRIGIEEHNAKRALNQASEVYCFAYDKLILEK